jgi:hypothetical protein
MLFACMNEGGNFNRREEQVSGLRGSSVREIGAAFGTEQGAVALEQRERSAAPGRYRSLFCKARRNFDLLDPTMGYFYGQRILQRFEWLEGADRRT